MLKLARRNEDRDVAVIEYLEVGSDETTIREQLKIGRVIIYMCQMVN